MNQLNSQYLHPSYLYLIYIQGGSPIFSKSVNLFVSYLPP